MFLTSRQRSRPGGALTIYTVPRVCQHRGYDFDKKCKRKGMFFGQKCKRKGMFSGREWNTRQQFSKIFGAMRHFSALWFRRGSFLAKSVKRIVCFHSKKCKRKGVFFANSARERVWVRRPRWHTRVQKLGKSPPPGDLRTPLIYCSISDFGHWNASACMFNTAGSNSF